MIRGDADVCRAVVEQLHDQAQDAADGRGVLARRVDCGRQRVEVPEQLVGAVDEDDVHSVNSLQSTVDSRF